MPLIRCDLNCFSLQADGSDPADWRQLQRHHLHPHYSSSILDDTINRPNNALQSAINRAIAGTDLKSI